MSLFDLFRKSEWSKLTAFPQAVQQDIACILAFEFHIRTTITNSIAQGLGRDLNGMSNEQKNLTQSIKSNQNFARELYLAILTTGIGKIFPSVTLQYLPPEKVVHVLGILTMCEYRNSEQKIVQNDLQYSGYSYDPDEARVQYLVMIADALKIANLDKLKRFDNDYFFDFWSKLRRRVYIECQNAVSSDLSVYSETLKPRFNTLSNARKETLVILADSLSQKQQKILEKKSEATKPVAPFDPELHKKEHPFMYVPYPKLIKLMDEVATTLLTSYKNLPIDENELRRLIRAKDSVPTSLLASMAKFDSEVLGYAIVAASIVPTEEKFVGAGVWKRMTETLEKRNLIQFQKMAEAQCNGMLGDATIDVENADPHSFSLGLNLVNVCRKAPTEYVKSFQSRRSENLPALFTGTVIFRHILNHPKYGKLLSSNVKAIFQLIEPKLVEMTKGELLNAEQQKQLTIEPPKVPKKEGVFISYATKYDSYVGSKNWNELTRHERKTIIEHEFQYKEMDFVDFVMASGLKKLQAQGIRSLFVASLMLNERIGSITPNVRSPKDTQHLLGIYVGTKFFKEAAGLLLNKAKDVTYYNAIELERLAQTNRTESILTDALDMGIKEAREFIISLLESSSD
jgi:hypothetical protein